LFWSCGILTRSLILEIMLQAMSLTIEDPTSSRSITITAREMETFTPLFHTADPDNLSIITYNNAHLLRVSVHDPAMRTYIWDSSSNNKITSQHLISSLP
jgi:hypothetical protein